MIIAYPNNSPASYRVFDEQVLGHMLRLIVRFLMLLVLSEPLKGRTTLILIIDLPRDYVNSLIVVLVLWLMYRRLLLRIHKLSVRRCLISQ